MHHLIQGQAHSHCSLVRSLLNHPKRACIFVDIICKLHLAPPGHSRCVWTWAPLERMRNAHDGFSVDFLAQCSWLRTVASQWSWSNVCTRGAASLSLSSRGSGSKWSHCRWRRHVLIAVLPRQRRLAWRRCHDIRHEACWAADVALTWCLIHILLIDIPAHLACILPRLPEIAPSGCRYQG